MVQSPLLRLPSDILVQRRLHYICTKLVQDNWVINSGLFCYILFTTFTASIGLFTIFTVSWVSYQRQLYLFCDLFVTCSVVSTSVLTAWLLFFTTSSMCQFCDFNITVTVVPVQSSIVSYSLDDEPPTFSVPILMPLPAITCPLAFAVSATLNLPLFDLH